jgi:hypothetical protein
LPWAHFVFLFLLFQVHVLIIFWIIIMHPPWSLDFTTWNGPSLLDQHLSTRLVLRFHQLSKPN